MSFSPCAEGNPPTASGITRRWVPPDFLRDPVFLAAALLLALNTLWFRPLWSGSIPFLSCYWNDLLLIPVALPPVLWLQSLCQWRPQFGAPTGTEIVFHLAVWSVLLEGIFPFLCHHGTADILDVLAYSFGAAISAFFWGGRSSV